MIGILVFIGFIAALIQVAFWHDATGMVYLAAAVALGAVAKLTDKKGEQ